MNVLLEIENSLLKHLHPVFFSVTQEENHILVVLAHPKYNYISIEDRIKDVYRILKQECQEILRTTTVIVQVFDSEEFKNLLDDVIEEENL